MGNAPLRIGNASAFWGDSLDAAATLAAQSPDLDCLTLDYLAEVSMSILARQRQRDPAAGFAEDFIDVVRSLAPIWRQGRRLRVVTNAGGLNPAGCAAACRKALADAGAPPLRIGVVSGDDVLGQIQAAHRDDPDTRRFSHLETHQPIGSIIDRLTTANAYLGAGPVAQLLLEGADMVITGRLADPSLTVGPCLAHFGWSAADYSNIAGATVAGHLIECGAQVTGGASTDWLAFPEAAHIGFPIAEVFADGSCIITKPPGSGGCVNERTVKEQLLYEIGDPARYLSPDATVSFLTLKVEDLQDNRVRVSGADGSPPPETYKVSATYRAGYRASGTLTIRGDRAGEKAARCGEIIRRRLADAAASPERYLAEVIGDGGEVVLRVSAADNRREVVERFSRELTPLVTAGPQGTTGYFEAKPAVREVFGYWPTLIDRSAVSVRTEFAAQGNGF